MTELELLQQLNDLTILSNEYATVLINRIELLLLLMIFVTVIFTFKLFRGRKD